MNVTFSVDEAILKLARKVAIDRDTTVSAMLRDYLTEISKEGLDQREQAAEQLKATFEKYGRQSRCSSWTRDELHERD
jgi:predicted translin family RNA/ssDNA-binding protein